MMVSCMGRVFSVAQLFAFFLVFVGNGAFAQDDQLTLETTNLIRKCAPSRNLSARLEGEIGGLIAKKIAGAQAQGSVEVFEDGELLGKMIEASPDDATLIYGMYLDCVKPELDTFLEARLVSRPLLIAPGHNFAMRVGESVQLLDGSHNFSVTGIRKSQNGEISRVRTTVSSPNSGTRKQHAIGDSARVADTGCRVVLQTISGSGEEFRFLLTCDN